LLERRQTSTVSPRRGGGYPAVCAVSPLVVSLVDCCSLRQRGR
jgi:hypothetical protein